MNVRELDRPWARRAARALNEFNDRHPWSHNDHYHRWVLRHLPTRRHAAIDVGCGRGVLLATLATRFEQAHGTGLDPAMREAARHRCAALGNVTVDAAQLSELGGPYDVITMVAALHHLDPAEALTQVRRLLYPGGRLLVVGLAPPMSATDQVWDVASMLANPVIGLLKHPRRASEPPSGADLPLRDPHLPLDDLRALTREVLPGAVIRRRLFFRHTVCWQQPAGA